MLLNLVTFKMLPTLVLDLTDNMLLPNIGNFVEMIILYIHILYIRSVVVITHKAMEDITGHTMSISLLPTFCLVYQNAHTNTI